MKPESEAKKSEAVTPVGSGTVLGCALPPVKIYLQWDGDGDPSDIEYVRLDKVAKLLKALRLVKNWNDALEAKWEDPGYLAIAALKEYEAA